MGLYLMPSNSALRFVSFASTNMTGSKGDQPRRSLDLLSMVFQPPRYWQRSSLDFREQSFSSGVSDLGWAVGHQRLRGGTEKIFESEEENERNGK